MAFNSLGFLAFFAAVCADDFAAFHNHVAAAFRAFLFYRT